MRIKIINSCSLLLILTILSACESYLYDEKKKITDAVWAYNDSPEFSFEISDTLSLYNIYLDIAHEASYNAQNLYTKVYVTFPDAKQRSEVVSLELADNRGEWLGKCNSKKCTRRISFMPNAAFEQIGKYKLKFEQFGRTDKIKGIESLRIIVEKMKTKKESLVKNKAKKKES